MDLNLGCLIVDLIHLPSDERVLDVIRANRRLELMTMGEVMAGVEWESMPARGRNCRSWRRSHVNLDPVRFLLSCRASGRCRRSPTPERQRARAVLRACSCYGRTLRVATELEPLITVRTAVVCCAYSRPNVRVINGENVR